MHIDWSGTRLSEGEITSSVASQIGISAAGCPRRGTRACLTCAYAKMCSVACEYQCVYGKDRLDCPHREHCPCGWADADVQYRIYKSQEDAMNFDEYQEQAARTMNHKGKLPPELNFALGLCGEAGEVAELIKKAYYHDHALSREEIIDEMGDVLWYLAALAQRMHLFLDNIALANLEKLKARYPTGFDAQRSKERK